MVIVLQIERSCDVAISVRGKPIANRSDMPTGDRPLHLYIKAVSRDGLDEAVTHIEKVLRETPLVTFQTSIVVGMEALPSFDVATRLRGPNGQFFKHITSNTGAQLSLRGKRSVGRVVLRMCNTH